MNIDNKEIRLNRYLASCGIGSRRACDELIEAGRVSINGKKVDELGVKVIPDRDIVEYRGEVVSPILGKRYFVYHKSRGVIVTKNDPEGRITVFDVLGKYGISTVGVNYVGRLDVNSEGVLLLINDGDLIHRLTHPRYHIKKVYDVRVNKKLTPEHISRMKVDGVESDGELLHAGDIVECTERQTDDSVWYRVDLYEGKNRQIRRMFSALGYDVMRLIRITFGPIHLQTLPVDGFRELTFAELGALRAAGYAKVPK